MLWSAEQNRVRSHELLEQGITSTSQTTTSKRDIDTSQIYSCDYQQLVLAYNWTCNDPNPDYPGYPESNTLKLPFYPAPAEAAGECSCNLRTVDDSLYSPFDGFQTCLDMVHKEDGDQDDDGDDDDEEDDEDDDDQYAKCNCCLYGAVAAT